MIQRTHPPPKFARREAWDVARKLHQIKGDLEENRATYFSPSEVWCLPAPNQSGGKNCRSSGSLHMHMPSKRDLISAELETVRVSRNPTTAVTASWRCANEPGSSSVCQRFGFLRDSTGSSKTRRQFYRLANCSKIKDIRMSGHVVTNHT